MEVENSRPTNIVRWMNPDANGKYPDDVDTDSDGTSCGQPAMAASGDGLSDHEEYSGFILDGRPTPYPDNTSASSDM